MDELLKLQQSFKRLSQQVVNVEERVGEVEKSSRIVTAKLSYLKEGVQELNDSIRAVGDDLDGFVEFFADEQRNVRERLTRLEEHTGLR